MAPNISGDNVSFIFTGPGVEIIFLSRRGAENPLSFSGRSSASGNGVDGQVHRTEFGAIVGLIGAEHGKQSMQQYD